MVVRYCVAPITAFGRSDLRRAGGKGANLGELARAGFPVPAGFIVTTAAYEQALRRSGAGRQLAGLLREALDGASVRRAVEAAGIPEEVAGAVRRAYRALGAGAVAVRSSATAEDLPQAAFAGQQESFLNVVGEDAVLDAVCRCWGSLWTERAVAYRERQGVAHEEVSIAVVVQRMVDAEYAGVMFTANPVTGARDEIVVDAGAGLGEAVVAGLTTPDHFVLGKRTRRLKQARTGGREVLVRPCPGGGTERVPRPADAGHGTLTRRRLRRLVRLGAAVERHFGAPQDIEWAWAHGRAYIVQTRPVTALPAPPLGRYSLERAAAMFVPEFFPVRPYPLDLTTWTGALFDVGREFLRSAGFRASPTWWTFEEVDGVAVRLAGMRPPAPTPRALLLPALLLRNAVRYDPRTWEDDPDLALGIGRVRAVERLDVAALEWDELHTALREAQAVLPPVLRLRLRYFPRTVAAIGHVFLLLCLLGRRPQMSALFSSGDIQTARVNRAVAALADRVRGDPSLRAVFAAYEPDELPHALASHPFQDELRTFLARYGHRETVSPLLVTQPTWSAAPEVVLGLLKGLAAAEPPTASGRPADVAVREDLLAHPLVRVPPLRSLTVRALDLVPWFVRVREDTRYYITTALPVTRRILLEFGRRLTDAGILDAPQDVFHLKLDELKLDELEHGRPWRPELRETVERRKRKRAELADTPLLDPRLTAAVREPAGKAGDAAVLHGIPASPGIVDGRARIIHDAHEFSRLRTGDVLVAPYTHPAWTPLFQHAAAVVVDSGGAASHAAIVAREYGIPAVMATGEGTRTLTDGQPVRVDGTRGVVLRRDRPEDGSVEGPQTAPGAGPQ
ncbi:PEP/pyruvate-binding domain-containing protein [Streptomyces sp. NPDC002845]